MKMPKPRDQALFERGIALFKELGEIEHAGRVELIMESFCRPVGAYSTPLQAQRKLRRYVRRYKLKYKKLKKLRTPNAS